MGKMFCETWINFSQCATVKFGPKKLSLFKQWYTNMEKEDIYDLKRISQNSFGEDKK